MRVVSLLCRYGMILCLLITTHYATAQALNPLSLDAYMTALPEVSKEADRLKQGPQGGHLFRAMQYSPVHGFAPHMNGVKWLAVHDHPSLQKLLSVVRPAGFASAESWARVGDRVALTYAALRLELSEPEWKALTAQAEAVPPELRALLPDVVRRQLDDVEAGVALLRQISPAEKALLRPHYSALDTIYRRLSAAP